MPVPRPMKFIDEAKIWIKAGDGGKGCVAFRREKFIPRGGPSGGNGGKGGDIILCGTKNMTTLMDFRFNKHVKAPKGAHGEGALKDGRGGQDVVMKVPLGTIIYNEDTNDVLGDITEEGQTLVIAKGGRGGKGNTFFKTSVNQAPQFAQPGEPGEEKNIRLELKLLADVGLVGMPNAGKSTLLSVISKAHPKIADYPFTTLTPVLGVVTHKNLPAFTVADIPGLIEGAHKGEGLGIQFLRHVERTKIFVHLVSVSPDETLSPQKRFSTIEKELAHYDPSFPKRKRMVLLTKIDLLPTKKALKEVMEPFKKKKLKVFAISAATRVGIGEWLDYLGKCLVTGC